jgi:hypothetical protein
MIVPSDPDYVETKLVKHGRHVLAPLFKDLAGWISTRSPGTSVLNIYCDKVASTTEIVLPRLSVIFEWESEVSTFRAADGMNYDRLKQAAVAAKLEELLNGRHEQPFDTKHLLVIFCAFEPVARLEAIWRVRPEQLTQLQNELNNPEIWKIRSDFGGLVVYLHTDVQLKRLEDELKTKCSNAFARIMNAYDEFGYFRKQPAQVTFDSKENFEKSYEGNWFYYDRR